MGIWDANEGIPNRRFDLYYFLQLALLGYGQVPHQLTIYAEDSIHSCRSLPKSLTGSIMSWMLQLNLAFITHKIGHPLAASLSGQQGMSTDWEILSGT